MSEIHFEYHQVSWLASAGIAIGALLAVAALGGMAMWFVWPRRRDQD